MTKLGSMISAAVMLALVATPAVQAQSTCVGDCSGTRSVHVTDLVLGVSIALGTEPVSKCPAFDCQHNDMVTVTCLIQGVNNALNGCPGGPTSTPTRTGGMTPTPTPMSGTTRVFSIDSLVGMLVTSDTPGSGLFNGSQLGGGNVAQDISPGPLTLVLGTPDANGIASLALQSDVTIAIDIPLDTSCGCLRLLAANQMGQIDCNGGTAYDTTITQTAANQTPPLNTWTIQTGQGSAAGPGNGELILLVKFLNVLNMTCAQADCEHVTYPDPPNQFPFTTTTATAVVNGAGTFSTDGAPFDCAHFATPGSGGELVSGVAMGSIVGPTSNTFRLSE